MDQNQPITDDDIYEKLMKQRLDEQFNPESEGYKRKQEETRQLSEQRDRKSDELQESARLDDLVGGILRGGSIASSIGGERQGHPENFNFLNDKAKAKRAQALEVGDLSRREGREDKASQDKQMYQYLQNKQAERRHQETIGAMKQTRADAADARKDDKLNKQVENVGKTLAPMQQVQNAVKNIEGQIGFDLLSYDPKTKTVDGKNVDLPGVSLPVVGRVSAYSQPAQDLDIAMSGLLNAQIKDTAGSAVSNGEMDRIRREFGQGKYSTEESLLTAARQYKEAALKELKNREAGFTPEARQQYANQGGLTSKGIERTPTSQDYLIGKKSHGSVKAAPMSSPRKIKVSNGRESLMIDPADLKDAQNDGYEEEK